MAPEAVCSAYFVATVVASASSQGNASAMRSTEATAPGSSVTRLTLGKLPPASEGEPQ